MTATFFVLAPSGGESRSRNTKDVLDVAAAAAGSLRSTDFTLKLHWLPAASARGGNAVASVRRSVSALTFEFLTVLSPYSRSVSSTPKSALEKNF